ncbi:MAG: serine/threonine-protein kinase [Pirellulales bacterium]
MIDESKTCRDEPLRRLLADLEDSAETQGTARHVETCAACRQRLEELAADRTEWLEATALLAPDATVETYEREWRDRTRSGTASDPQAALVSEKLVRQYLAPPSHPELLGRLGRYEVERWIGAGGMGIVLKGFDPELNRPVAIKVLAPHLAANGAARQRFAREARAAAAVVHEHVVAIHNVESDDTLPFLVMQYVPGESLQTRIDRRGPLDVVGLLRIAHQTAAGLAAAHTQGLVHRDVKPSNILLAAGGVERALLTDFGLARASDDASLTHTGYLPGTPNYMSPEQARGEAVDGRSDLFSLGSVMYAMATGRPPFRAETSFAVLRRITDSRPRPVREVNPDTPDWLAAVIERLLAKEAAERCESAAELATLLAGCLAHVQQPDSAALPAEVARWTRARERRRAEEQEAAARSGTRPLFRRIKRPGLAWGVVATLALGILAIGIRREREAPRETPRESTGLPSKAKPPTSLGESDGSSNGPTSTSSQASLAWDAADRELGALEDAAERLDGVERRVWRYGGSAAEDASDESANASSSKSANTSASESGESSESSEGAEAGSMRTPRETES